MGAGNCVPRRKTTKYEMRVGPTLKKKMIREREIWLGNHFNDFNAVKYKAYIAYSTIYGKCGCLKYNYANEYFKVHKFSLFATHLQCASSFAQC